MRILRRPEVEHRTGLSKTQIYRLEALGQFPRRVQITARCVGWREPDVDDFIASRPTLEPAQVRSAPQ